MSRTFVTNLSFLMAAVFGLLIVVPVNAQSSSPASSISMDPKVSAPVYDIAKEIVIQGTVAMIEPNASGSASGAHIRVQTMEGAVDVHLGASAAISAESLGLAGGQKVTVTGMMASVGGNQVLLARLLTTSTHIFILRNEHGIPVRSLMQRRTAASQKPLNGGL